MTNQEALLKVYREYVQTVDIPQANKGREFAGEVLKGTSEEIKERISGMLELLAVFVASDPEIAEKFATFVETILESVVMIRLKVELDEEIEGFTAPEPMESVAATV